MGCYNKNYLENESVHQGYIRKKLNFTLPPPVTEIK